eukprot:320634-Chlamydomonas_euryale.AAC.1
MVSMISYDTSHSPLDATTSTSGMRASSVKNSTAAPNGSSRPPSESSRSVTSSYAARRWRAWSSHSLRRARTLASESSCRGTSRFSAASSGRPSGRIGSSGGDAAAAPAAPRGGAWYVRPDAGSMRRWRVRSSSIACGACSSTTLSGTMPSAASASACGRVCGKPSSSQPCAVQSGAASRAASALMKYSSGTVCVESMYSLACSPSAVLFFTSLKSKSPTLMSGTPKCSERRSACIVLPHPAGPSTITRNACCPYVRARASHSARP